MDFDNQLDPSTITDVETAKLALRWAVEKIHTLSDDNSRLKEDNRNKTNIARSLTQQTEEKDEILKKWQSTIKTWEENWRTQTAMEADLKGKLREQILNEETSNWRQARAQLENEIRALKEELGSREAEIGRLKIMSIEEIRRSADLKEAELQALLRGRQDAMAEQESAMRSKFELLEKELVENSRIRAEQEELALKERYELKMREFSKLYQAKETQLENFRKALEDEYLKKSEDLGAIRAAKLEEDRRDMTARQEAAMAEAEKAAERRRAALQEEFDRQRTAMTAAFEEKEAGLAAAHAQQTAFLKETHQKELAEIRDRLRQHTQQREQDYVNLRLQMENQMLELVKKHDEAAAAAYNTAALEVREKWNRLSVDNQKKLDSIVAATNSRWEKDWSGREAELTARADARLAEEKERIAAGFRAKEDALRKSLLREQSERAAKEAAELETTKLDMGRAHEERLGLVKQSLENAYQAKEKDLEARLAAREKGLAAAWLAKEEEWTLEKEHALLEQREGLKDEFSKYRGILKEKFLQFEDELKLKYAHKELELADRLKEENQGLEKALEKRLAAEKQHLAGQFEEKKKALARKELELEKTLDEARRRVEAEKSEFENRLAEHSRELLAKEESVLAEKFTRREAALAKEHAARLTRAETEKAGLEKTLSDKDAAFEIKTEELRRTFEERLKEEKIKIEEVNHTRELHLKAQEGDLEKLKKTLLQQHSELKVKLYQELQAKEGEQFSLLAKAKEEMYKALNEHRAIMDREYESRFADLRGKETKLEADFAEKAKERLETLKKQKEDETDKLTLEFENKKAELERQYQNREKSQQAAAAEKMARIEAEAARREKDRSALEEKNLAKRRDELENLARQKENELEKRYLQLSSDLSAGLEKERAYWETHKLEVLNQERQSMRSEFEKKEALLSQKLDEELSKSKQQRIRLEEEASSKKNELEKFYYAEVEKSRTALDKLRLELENRIKAKFRELEEEKTRLTMLIAQKEEEYVAQYQKKEEELLAYWGQKQKELELKYERALKAEKDKK